jgi:hypothetical protein
MVRARAKHCSHAIAGAKVLGTVRVCVIVRIVLGFGLGLEL